MFEQVQSKITGAWWDRFAYAGMEGYNKVIEPTNSSFETNIFKEYEFDEYVLFS